MNVMDMSGAMAREIDINKTSDTILHWPAASGDIARIPSWVSAVHYVLFTYSVV